MKGERRRRERQKEKTKEEKSDEGWKKEVDKTKNIDISIIKDK